MAQPPKPQSSRTKWIWVALIVVLSVLILIVLLNPTGDRDGTVDDPIVIENTGEGRGVGQTPVAPGPAPEPFAPGGDPEG